MSYIRKILLLIFYLTTSLHLIKAQVVHNVKCMPNSVYYDECYLYNKGRVLKDSKYSIVQVYMGDTLLIQGTIVVEDMLINSGVIIIDKSSKVIVHNEKEDAKIINYEKGKIVNMGHILADFIVCFNGYLISENSYIFSKHILMGNFSSLTLHSSNLVSELIYLDKSIICLSNHSEILTNFLNSESNILTLVSIDKTKSVVKVTENINISEGVFCINNNIVLEICDKMYLHEKHKEYITVTQKTCD